MSKILVPHPVLGEPTKIQILYIAYSGWLSSGLARWKIDKVSFTDSFGRVLSVCQKGLDLETGKSVLLPLHEGDCEPSTSENQVLYRKSDDSTYTEGWFFNEKNKKILTGIFDGLKKIYPFS